VTLKYSYIKLNDELDGPATSAIAQVKQRWSVIGWVTKNLLSRTPSCFGRHIKPLSCLAHDCSHTNPHWARVVGYGLFSLCVIHKEGLCPRSGDINSIMMIEQIFHCKYFDSDKLMCCSLYKSRYVPVHDYTVVATRPPG
jgi:hypothetical protein